jgi:hypothetical protein
MKRSPFTSEAKPLHFATAVPNQEQKKNVLPDLTVVDWGRADYYGMPIERIKGIALLRALSDVRADQ